jgi:hypothetical protein
MNVHQEEFERIRTRDVEAYEIELKLRIERMHRMRERGENMGKQLAALAKQYGGDLRSLDAIHQRAERELEPFVRENRPPLITRQVPADFDEHALTTYSGTFDRLKAGRAEFVGAYSLAARTEDFEDVPGESGNPWLFPPKSTAQVIRLGAKDEGEGSGCFTGLLLGPDRYTSVFGFVPDKPGIVRIEPLIFAHGFYIIKSEDTCVTCKWARIYASVGMSVIQDNISTSSSEVVLIDRDGDNIDEQGTIDKRVSVYCDRLVVEKKPVLIQVNVDYEVQAKGGGSYAEVNFKTGENHILCPQVWWHPIGGLWAY